MLLYLGTNNRLVELVGSVLLLVTNLLHYLGTNNNLVVQVGPVLQLITNLLST